VEDKLFATLDTTTRKYFLPNKQEILLIDTVGFIRKIPHTLIAAFKSTLEEAIHTDVLLHLIDASSPYAIEQAEETLKVLEELGVKDQPVVTVLNKIVPRSANAPKAKDRAPAHRAGLGTETPGI
jgi:GTP-binding protein HflX